MMKLFLVVLFLSSAENNLSAREKTMIDIVLDDDSKYKKRKKLSKKTVIMRSEVYFASVEKKLIKGIDRTIKYLYTTLRSLPKKSPARHGILEKILNLHIEQASYISSTEHRIYDRAWKRWSMNRRGQEPRLDNNKSHQLWNKVANIATLTFKEFPKSKRGDQLLFSKAIAYTFVNKFNAASNIFKTVVKKYPNSNFAGESYFALGDFYFDRTRFEEAIKYYKLASKYKRSKRYGWSLFKLGWCYFNLSKFKQSLQTWKKTVQFSKRERNKNNIRLREEVLQDMIYAFAELKMLKSAITYYRINGSKQNVIDMLNSYATIVVSQGKFQDAINSYRKLLSIDPYNEEAPKINNEIVGLLNELGKKEQMWSELEKLPVKYSKNNSWARRNANDRVLIADAQKMIKERILYYAKLSHVNAQKKKGNKKVLLPEAEKGYNLYLRNFSYSKGALEVKYLLGDVLYLQKKYMRSAKVYSEIIKLKPELAVIKYSNKKVENIHVKSAKYMLESHFLYFKPEFQKIIKLKPQPKKAPRPISAKAQGFIKACKLYLTLYPKDQKKRKECDVHIAEIYYRLNHRKEAKVHMLMLAKRYSKLPEGVSAVENIIPLYGSDKVALSMIIKELMTMPSYSKGKLGVRLKKLFLGIKVDEVATVKGDSAKANRYENLVKKYPRIENADKLLFNAAAGYVNSGDFISAIRVYSNLIKNYAKSPLAVEGILKLAKIYDKNLQYKLASRYYLEYTKRAKKKDNILKSSLTRSCQLKIFSYEDDMLNTCLKLIFVDKNNYKIIITRLFRTLYLEKKHSSLLSLIRNNYLNKLRLSANEKIIALHYLYRSEKMQGKSGSQYANQIITTFRQASGSVSGEALKHVGEVVFNSVDGALNKFMRVKLQGGTVDKMLSSMNVKSSELIKLERQYGRVLSTRDSYWGVAAFHQIAAANVNLANALKNPPQIKGAKVSDVKKQLSPQARIMENKARKYLTDAQNIIRRYQVLNPWVAKINSLMGMLSNKKRSFQEWVVEPDFVGYEITNL